jgi:hypothetical protein
MSIESTIGSHPRRVARAAICAVRRIFSSA